MKTKALMVIAGIAGVVPLPDAQAEACVNGESAGYACSHIEFLGHLTPAGMNGSGEVLNDIWGWVDPSVSVDNEYAIVGMQDGTAFVRILDDGTPVFLGRLAASDGQAGVAKARAPDARKSCHDDACGSDSAWRDIKVYSNDADGEHYAYIVSEATAHGVQVFDLQDLRAADGETPVDFEMSGYYGGIGHAHNIFINEETARAYVVGHDGPGVAGGLHILDISVPETPVEIGEVNGDGYTHDVQCVVYRGPDVDVAADRELCFASNEDSLTIWDVTDADAPVMLSRTTYSESGYTHQGWLSDDQRYFFLNDELDERGSGTRTHLRVFDVSDVDAPSLAADYLAPTLAIDHNNYVHGRWLYQSNYAAGLRILDVLDPLHPVEAAYFDPQPTDHANFYGTWSNYRFPSGITVFSDINAGLYVVRPMLDEVTMPDLTVALSLVAGEAEEGENIEGELTLGTGPAVGASDTLLTLHLPSGAIFTAVEAPPGWTCEGTEGGRVTECRKDVLDISAQEVFHFGVQSSVGGAVRVIAMAYANAADAAPEDNLDEVVLQVKSAGGNGGGGGGALAWLLPLLGMLGCARVALARR